MKDRRIRSTFLIILCLISGTLVIRFASFIKPSTEKIRDRADNIMYDLTMKFLTRKTDKLNDFVVINVTQDCLESFKRQKQPIGWPWPRYYYNNILEFCERGGAKVVFFDLLFTDSSREKNEDKMFEAGLKKTKKTIVIFAAEFENELNEYIESLKPDKLLNDLWSEDEQVRFDAEESLKDLWFVDRVRKGIEVAQAKAKSENKEEIMTSCARILDYIDQLRKFSLEVNLNKTNFQIQDTASVRFPVNRFLKHIPMVADVRQPSDIDKVVRRYNIVSKYKGKYYPSAALSVLMATESVKSIEIENNIIKVGSKKIPVDNTGYINLKFYGGVGTFVNRTAFPVIKAGQILNMGEKIEDPDLDPKIVKDKIVLVGLYFPGSGDIKNTPVEHSLPGADVHATALVNILSEDYLKKIDAPLEIAFSLFYIVLCPWIFRFGRIMPSMLFWSFVIIHTGLVGYFYYFQNTWISWFPQFMAILSSYITTLAVSYTQEGRHKKEIQRMFKTYVSPAVANKLVERLEGQDKKAIFNPKGERRVLTVFFLDFVNFTSAVEEMKSEDVVTTLREYFNIMRDEIFNTEGTIDKFIGDSVMAFWGNPNDQPDHTIRACKTAIAIQKRMPEISKKTNNHIKACIGINTGEMVVGDIGASTIRNYSVIGDSVNLASRVEGTNRFFGTSIIITEATFNYDVVKNSVSCREIGLVRVKGKSKHVRLYEVIDLKENIDANKKKFLDDYSTALNRFRTKEYNSAFEAFSALSQSYPDDKLISLYKEISANLLKNPPLADKEYVHELTQK